MAADKCSSVRVTASIHTEKKLNTGYAPAVIKFAILLCGCLGSFFTFLSCIDTGTKASYTAVMITVFCAFFSAAMSREGKTLYISFGAAAAVMTAYTYFMRNEICAGMANVSNLFLARINPTYRDKPFIYITEPERIIPHTRAFLCFAALAVCFLAAHAAFRCSSASGVALSTCVPVFSVLMFGMEPNNAAFFSAVVCWTAMFALEANAAEGISDARCKKYSAYCGLYTAVISAVCIFAVITVSKAAGYERPERLNIMYDEASDYIRGGKVQKVIDDIVTIAVKNIVPTGAINHGKLGEFEEISFSGKTVLTVNIPKSDETIYLRGFVGSVYTGSSWEKLSRSKLEQLGEITGSFGTDGLSPMLIDGYNLKYAHADMPKYSFTANNEFARDGYLYMPYNLVPESVSRYDIVDDSGFSGPPTYIGQFYDPREYYGYQNLFRKKWSAPPLLTEDEAAYRRFVYDNYLELPDGFSHSEIFGDGYYSYISAETEKTGKSTLDEMTVLNRKVYFIKKWLRDNCEYSLSTEKLKIGEDFVESFLGSRKGSCSHFASAGVLMCRYAGIPARYVEGYVIKPSDFPENTETGKSATVEVTDARGHAWGEIYLDGFGWYPIEFTSGYGNVRTAIPTETAETETETETESAAETTETVTETEVSPISEAAEQQSSPQPAEQSEEPAAGSENAAVTTVPPETEPLPKTEVAEEKNSETEKPSVGFGVFGIKSGRHVDIYYDMTWLFIAVAAAVIVPSALILRRNIISARRREKLRRSAKDGALDDYGRFIRLMKLMKMPEQGDMSCGEYIKALSERPELPGDGTAEFIICCALKASFGGDSMTRSDANEMRLAVNSLAKRYCVSASRTERFMAKFIYCII